jgi:hypothetical protein
MRDFARAKALNSIEKKVSNPARVSGKKSAASIAMAGPVQ